MKNYPRFSISDLEFFLIKKNSCNNVQYNIKRIKQFNPASLLITIKMKDILINSDINIVN